MRQSSSAGIQVPWLQGSQYVYISPEFCSQLNRLELEPETVSLRSNLLQNSPVLVG